VSLATPASAGPTVEADHPHHPWVYSIAGNIAARVLSLGSTVIVARTLGPLSRGIVAAAMVWPAAFTSVGALVGIGTAAFFSARKGLIGLQACLIIALASAALLLPISATVNSAVFRGPQRVGLLYADLYLVSIPITLISYVFLGALLGRGKVEDFWRARGSGGLVLLISVVVIAACHRLSIITYIIASLSGAVATAAMARHFTGPIALSPDLPKTQVREVLAYSARVFTTTIPSQLHIRLDQLVLSLLIPLDQLGIYAVAQSWASAVSIVSGGLATVIVSRTVQLNPTDANSLSAGFRRVRRASLLAIVISVGVALVAPLGLPLVFGARYQSAVVPAMILSFSAAFSAWKGMLHEFSRSIGRPAAGSLPEVIGLLVAAAALIVLVPAFGTRGAATAALLSYVVLLVAFAVRLRGLMASTPIPWPRLQDLDELARDAISYAKHRLAR
jgi:O-antigen/teichoic acid export membrane protein